MLVREVMTSPAVTLTSGTPVQRALEMLDQHAITQLPVTNESGRIVGVLSEADVLRPSARPRPPHQAVGAAEADLGSRLVAELMDRHPLTVSSTADLATAEALMSGPSVTSLPVVDDDGRVLGVISRRDLVHVLARTDDAIARDLTDLLRRVGTDWTVDVDHGAVTVGGDIRPAEHVLAELAAMTVLGVRMAKVDPD